MDTAQAPVLQEYLCKCFAYREVNGRPPAWSARARARSPCADVRVSRKGVIRGGSMSSSTPARLFSNWGHYTGGSLSGWISRGWQCETRIMRPPADTICNASVDTCDARWRDTVNVRSLNDNARKVDTNEPEYAKRYLMESKEIRLNFIFLYYLPAFAYTLLYFCLSAWLAVFLCSYVITCY